MKRSDIHKVLLLLCLVLMLSNCSILKKKKPPPPPEPTRVVLEFEAAGDINQNSDGRASPLYVRVYQLRSYSVFDKADFLSLYDNDNEVLGNQLVNKQEILLQPNEKRTVFFEASDETRTVGLLGLFMRYEKTQCKAAAGIQANKTSVINVYINGSGLTVR